MAPGVVKVQKNPFVRVFMLPVCVGPIRSAAITRAVCYIDAEDNLLVPGLAKYFLPERGRVLA